MLTLWHYIHRNIRDEGWEQRTKPAQEKKTEREKTKLNTERLECTIENEIRRRTALKKKSKEYSRIKGMGGRVKFLHDLHLHCNLQLKPTCAIMT